MKLDNRTNKSLLFLLSTLCKRSQEWYSLRIPIKDWEEGICQWPTIKYRVFCLSIIRRHFVLVLQDNTMERHDRDTSITKDDKHLTHSLLMANPYCSILVTVIVICRSQQPNYFGEKNFWGRIIWFKLVAYLAKNCTCIFIKSVAKLFFSILM